MSRSRDEAMRAALPALQELVRLKKLKEKFEEFHFKLLQPTAEELAEENRLRAEYDAGKAAAWAAAKAVFEPCGQCGRAWDHDCWYLVCGRPSTRRRT